MVTYLPRSAWNARPPTNSVRLTASQVEGVAVHWPGMTNPLGRDRVAAALRGWQDYHMAPPPAGRGWSDIAYQVAVDQWGRAWILRGLGIRSAANGDRDVNERFGAILLVLAPGEQPSAAMKATTREVVADFQRAFPAARRIVPHSLIRPEPTDCPGDLARAAITRGDFEPMEDDMQWTDTVPGYTEPDGTGLSLAEGVRRGDTAYGWLKEGGAIDKRLDDVAAALAGLAATPQPSTIEGRLAALEAFTAKLREALA